MNKALRLFIEAILCLATNDRAVQSLFSNALSEAVSKHIPLSATRLETLAWLTLLIMRQGTICL
jgi:hypothetical protein